MQHYWNGDDRVKARNLEFICQKYPMNCPRSDIWNLCNVVFSYFVVI